MHVILMKSCNSVDDFGIFGNCDEFGKISLNYQKINLNLCKLAQHKEASHVDRFDDLAKLCQIAKLYQLNKLRKILDLLSLLLLLVAKAESFFFFFFFFVIRFVTLMAPSRG